MSDELRYERIVAAAPQVGPTVVELGVRRLAQRAGAALALVHRLDAGDRDRAALLDQIGGQRLGLGKVVSPRVAAAE